MKKDKFTRTIEQSTANFSKNLKLLLTHKGINQKILGVDLDVSPSTISAYINGSKIPTSEFLLKLKTRYPELSIDEMLTGEPTFSSSAKEPASTGIGDTDLAKYDGSYFSYYLDTSENNRRSSAEITTTESVLKKGLFYIYRNIFSDSSSEARCLAVFGIRSKSSASVKAEIDQMHTPTEIELYLQKSFPHNLYKGTAKFTSSHIFISLTQEQDKKDMAFIILHHQDSTHAEYFGGVGTINSTSRGRFSDPVVQLIGFSRYAIRLSDEEIKSRLLFSPPAADMSIRDEANDILNLARKLYGKAALAEDKGDSLLEKYASAIVQENIQYLVDKRTEANLLWYGKVSNDYDDNWYHLLKHSLASQSETEGDGDE